MHARVRRKTIPAVITARLSAEEREQVMRCASEDGLTLSEYIRRTLTANIAMDAAQRLILAEVCATRKEVEDLLLAISDLDGNDIERARAGADRLRHVSVERRLLELKLVEEVENA